MWNFLFQCNPAEIKSRRILKAKYLLSVEVKYIKVLPYIAKKKKKKKIHQTFKVLSCRENAESAKSINNDEANLLGIDCVYQWYGSLEHVLFSSWKLLPEKDEAWDAQKKNLFFSGFSNPSIILPRNKQINKNTQHIGLKFFFHCFSPTTE